MNLDNNAFVTPGEKIGTEEEFASGNNTYVEEGVIYSSVMGKVVKAEGSVGVATAGREIILIGKDMLVMGTVTDDMKNVTFVKLSDINVEKKDYLALKDGKILAPKPRMGGGGRFGGGGGRFNDRGGGGDGNRFTGPEKVPKPCGVGDTIIARVLYNDKDSYTLSLNGNETGVIYAKCSSCGGEVEKKAENMLVCSECGHRMNRKISELYNKPQDIKKLFA